MEKPNSSPDFLILASTLMLLSIGLTMVYSSSMIIAMGKGDPLFFVSKQLGFSLLGVCLMFLLAHIRYGKWKDWAKALFMGCLALMLLVLIFGKEVNGAKRWFSLGGLGIQPSEFLKIGLIVWLAKWFSDRDTIGVPLGATALSVALVMMQPDLGLAIVLLAGALLVIFVSGCRFLYLFGILLTGLASVSILAFTAPYRLRRLTSFLDPWQDPLGAGYQQIQAYYAIGPGRLTGLGLGMSRQKFYYLPEPYNDFIFAIIAEELGFIGGVLILLLFLLIIWRGMRIAITLQDSFGSLLAAGITGMIGIQVFLNTAIVLGLLPVTGITLPLISYGGSSLLMVLTCIGILLNLSRYVPDKQKFSQNKTIQS